ncbi:predicted protein [Lichtheimia corymbifera JMRC:FSU:9682]|uniref:Uncharacterized protein n=1 Tax=Lichtheimia corymbifera JMRC:FSU:9682 TaxID=1263082 RepID=A0A068S4U3_9FUNG|nr:predicted protein [Lichtheimia corymbifera JMRC:FSU:9682]
MKRGVFNRTKLLVGVKRTLGASFTIQLADPRFSQSEIGESDRETCTQGALHPDEQLCSIEDPTFHCKV